MRVFLAGATGAIGRPLVDALVAAGHEVTGTTRSQSRAEAIRAQGAEPVVLDAFDAEAVRSAVVAARPDVLVHQLTELPQDMTPRAMRKAGATTAALRRDTVPVFLAAAAEAGARRAVVQGISFVTAPDGREVHDESAPLWLDGPAEFREIVAAERDMEAAVASTAGIDGLVLRYGFFYGPGTWYDPKGAVGKMVSKRRFPIIGDGAGLWSFIHIDDAVAATVAALDRGTPGIYNVTDGEAARQREWLPELARLLGAKRPRRVPRWLARLAAGEVAVHYATTLPAASSARAQAELGLAPRPWRDGFAQVFGRA